MVDASAARPVWVILSFCLTTMPSMYMNFADPTRSNKNFVSLIIFLFEIYVPFHLNLFLCTSCYSNISGAFSVALVLCQDHFWQPSCISFRLLSRTPLVMIGIAYIYNAIITACVIVLQNVSKI